MKGYERLQSRESRNEIIIVFDHDLMSLTIMRESLIITLSSQVNFGMLLYI